MNVLLAIAENRAVCETLQAALPESDLIIFEANLSGAGRRLVTLQADAILLDDGPGLGVEALGPLKAIAPGTPVIVMSARGDLVTQAGLTRAGADQVLVKPFSCEALRAAIIELSPGRPAPKTPETDRGNGAAHGGVLGQHQMALRWLSRATVHAEDPALLSQRLVEAAIDIFDAVRCAVLLETPEGVRVAAAQGIPPAVTGQIRLSYAAGLMRWFDEHASLIDRKRAEQDPGALKELLLLNARLATPLLRHGRVFGALLLGEKASGLDYTHEERELMTLVARATSMAFERAGARIGAIDRESALEQTFTQMHAGLIAVAPDKTISMMNPQAEKLLEVQAGDMLGRSVQKLGSAFADVVLRTLSDRKPRVRQEIRDPAIGATLGLSATPLDNGGVIVVFSKLPETQVASEEIAYSPFWEYLSSRVAQEIKNPMVAINTFAQLLPRKYDSEEFRDAFSRVVQSEVARINGVVETLFEFAQDPKLTLKRTNINDSVEKVLKAFEEEMAKRSIRVETHWGRDLVDAELDPVHFSQALKSVLQNSIDAMGEGGTLSITTEQQGGSAEIRITDTGPGVPPESEPLVFLPFYSSRERGMGLGLAMANRIMRQHQGELKLAANGGQGSTFSFRLPTTEKIDANHPGD